MTKKNRKTSAFYVFASLVLSFFIFGCRPSPTYKNESLEGTIVKMCKDEHNISVKTKRAGRTLGVYILTDGLFESASNVSSSGSLKDVLSGIKFTEDAIKKIDNTSLVISRVALSTDAPVDFYVLITADTKGSGIQIVITRYIMDMKRLMLGDVSRGDYFQRLLMEMGFDPVPAATEAARNFFFDLARLPSGTVAARYFSNPAAFKASSSNFFTYLSELDFKKTKKFTVTYLKGMQIDKSKVLVRCRAKEAYTPMPGYEKFKFLYPPDFEIEYFIVVDTAFIPYNFAQVLRRQDCPAYLSGYLNDDIWDEGDFFLEDVRLPEFLAQQLASRIRIMYQSDPSLKDGYDINLAKGEYQPASRSFKIVFDLEKKTGPSGGARDQKQIVRAEEFDAIWALISRTMRRYEYNDYRAIELFNIADNKKAVMTRQELLDKFWPRWLLKNPWPGESSSQGRQK